LTGPPVDRFRRRSLLPVDDLLTGGVIPRRSAYTSAFSSLSQSLRIVGPLAHAGLYVATGRQRDRRHRHIRRLGRVIPAAARVPDLVRPEPMPAKQRRPHSDSRGGPWPC
jgi:hypothetical protein